MAEPDIELTFDTATGEDIVHTESFKGDMNPYMAHTFEDDAASVASSDEEDFPVHVDDGHGKPVHYPGEDEKHAHHKVKNIVPCVYYSLDINMC